MTISLSALHELALGRRATAIVEELHRLSDDELDELRWSLEYLTRWSAREAARRIDLPEDLVTRSQGQE